MKNRLRTRTHGIFLITTLFIVTFLVMIGAATMSEVLQSLNSSGSFADRETASQAALSGLAYIQARLESNCATLAPAPDGTGLVTSVVLPGFDIEEKGYNVVGVMTDQNVDSTGTLRVMFRASFNKSYNAYSVDAAWPAMAMGLPPLTYASLNCLRVQPNGPTYPSYNNGAHLHDVPPQMADIIVEGLVVRADGGVRARRTAEAFVKLSDVATMNEGPISAAGNVSLDLKASGDRVTVTSLSGAPRSTLDGITTLSNINILSPDPGSGPGSPPPDYLSSAKATLPSGHNFNYGAGSVNPATGVVTFTGPPTDYSGNPNVTRAKSVPPPALMSNNLPALSPTAGLIPAGTWVEYNNLLYHFPVAFQATLPNGTPMTAEQEPIAVVGGVLQYNGVSPVPPTGQTSLDGGAATSFDPATNRVTISKDVAIQPTAGISSFGIVAAPSTLQASGTSNSVQLNLQPVTAGTSLQVRSADSLSVVGDVLGSGSVVIGQVGATAATVPADVTITGKSNLETGTDTGIALYSTGNVNLVAVDPLQPPSGIAAAPTSSSATDQALANAIANTAGFFASGKYYTSASGNVGLLYVGGTGPGSTASSIAGTTVDFYDASGNHYVGSNVLDILWQISNGGPGRGGPTPPSEINVLDTTLSAYLTSNWHADPSPPPAAGATPLEITWQTWQQNQTQGTGFSGLGGPAPSGTPNPAAAYDQSFNGMIYAYNGFNTFNSNNLTVSGALITYGGNPNTGAPGSGAPGNINVVGNSLDFIFDPTKVGAFANFFGGQVTLTRTAVSMF